MPIVELHLLEGYGSDEKRRVGEAKTDALRPVVPAEPEATTIMIHEIPEKTFTPHFPGSCPDRMSGTIWQKREQHD